MSGGIERPKHEADRPHDGGSEPAGSRLPDRGASGVQEDRSRGEGPETAKHEAASHLDAAKSHLGDARNSVKASFGEVVAAGREKAANAVDGAAGRVMAELAGVRDYAQRLIGDRSGNWKGKLAELRNEPPSDAKAKDTDAAIREIWSGDRGAGSDGDPWVS